MLGYHFKLAIRSLSRNPLLTVLMIAAVGVGIGASMTMLTTLVAMSANPIPDKSSQLFVPQLDVGGYASLHHDTSGLFSYDLPYRDAMAIMAAQVGPRQTAMYPIALDVKPPRGDPFQAVGRATYSDFFAMFEAPFASGSAWARAADQDRANVVVLSAKFAQRLFPGAAAVGRTVNLGDRDYRVSGVLRPWAPTPRFYDVRLGTFRSGAYGDPEDFYVPFSTGIALQIDGNNNPCDAAALTAEWLARLNSNCSWIQVWVELPTPLQARNFKTFLSNYAATQQQTGRFAWLPLTAVHDVMEWLALRRVVPEQVRVNSAIAVGFLVVCLINAIGLMLAKFSGRAVELSVRRALGASRNDLFLLCLTEAMVIGLLGGLLGLALTGAGLAVLRELRGIVSRDSAAGHLISLNMQMVLITLAVAIVATVCSGLYPALRASRIHPGWQLQAQ
jgi:putative ABC transport system permease protein